MFLPTFGEIVRQQQLLADSGAALLTRVLHSSVDVDECIAACEPAPGCGKRVVILATPIAETSITVPGVGTVVDFCRTCNLYWDPLRQESFSRVEWASHSGALRCRLGVGGLESLQRVGIHRMCSPAYDDVSLAFRTRVASSAALEQRKGRTGRTCDGTVYRLLPQEKYRLLPAHERPMLQAQSLRKEALILLASEDKALADPHYLLSRTMDPPVAKTVDEARWNDSRGSPAGPAPTLCRFAACG